MLFFNWIYLSHQISFLPQHRVVGPPFSYTTTQDEYKMKSFISTFENVALCKRILRDGLLSDMSDNSRYQNLVAAYHKAYLPTGTTTKSVNCSPKWVEPSEKTGGGSCKIKTSSAGGGSLGLRQTKTRGEGGGV